MPRLRPPARMAWPRALTLLLLPVDFGLLALGVAALIISPSEEAPFFVMTAAVSIPLVVLGNLVARREPRNLVGFLLAFAGVVLVALGTESVYALAALARPDVLPTSDVVVSLAQGDWMWLYTPLAMLLLFFPTGRLPSGRWAAIAIGLPLLSVTFMVFAAMVPLPYEPPFQDAPKALGTLPLGESAVWPVLFALLGSFMACLIASATSLRVRYRRSNETEKAQLKWMASAGLTIPVTLLLCWASWLLSTGPELLFGVGLISMFVAIPAATTVAILRYDLYDVDRVLTTTVTFVMVSTALLALFGLTSLVLGLTIGDSRVATAAATAAAALALQPLRVRLQRGVNRRLYPLRQGALTGIEDLRRRTAAGQARPEQLEAVLQAALHDPGLRVGYRAPGSDALLDADGQPLEAADGAVPVRSGSREIGVLVPGRTIPSALASEVADAAAVLVELVTLRLELNRALEDVEASRARLLQAGYAERRRLERDLHDGAQQRLVSLGMALRVAQRHLTDGSLDVHGVMDEAVTELSTAVAELRQIASGLRPSALDDGLAPALQILTSKMPFAIDLDVNAGELDDAVSTTAYYVAAEAVTNAIKHAQPGRIALSVARDDGHVEVRVRDDGLGGAVLRPGSGLAGLRDRVAALGGSLDVRSSAGAGTEVRAVLPCAS